MYVLGYDIGSSSIKAALLEVETGKLVAAATSPKTEMAIVAPHASWAEQDPEIWWEHVKLATAEILTRARVAPAEIKALGISYQMHGLVLIDKQHNVLRPAIIWCDSRAVEIGEEAFHTFGEEACLKNFLNSPGNFTAAKLQWVARHEPEVFARVYKMMLPGDFIAMKMCGAIRTTPSGLSEGILWNFPQQTLAHDLLAHWHLSPDLIPEIVPTFAVQGELTQAAARELGLHAGTKISYRAGDQPNNAFSLRVLRPGELAATAGTSGVVYGVGEQPDYDARSRVNTFVHVNHSAAQPRYGVLLCVNGTGSLNRWLKNNFGANVSYAEMNALAARAPIGAEGLSFLPFGNGAERTLENQNLGAALLGLNLNTHERAHVLRAGQEGIVFALNYGVEIMRGMGLRIQHVRAGHANMFLSPLFCEAFATITNATIELFDTEGAQGAARAAAVGAGIYKNFDEAFVGLRALKTVAPNTQEQAAYHAAYERWRQRLQERMAAPEFHVARE